MVLDIDGGQLYYETHGAGEPLLWLHGGLGCGADWRHIFPTVPAGYQLIAPDLRGHGRSSGAGPRPIHSGSPPWTWWRCSIRCGSTASKSSG